jgi:hypothetical protein
MMKSNVCLLLFLGLFGCAKDAKSDALMVVEDAHLIQMLNNIELVEDRHEYPLRVRIFRLRELGECDMAYVRCPKETFYIAVSTYDEDPDQNLFVLPDSLGWQFGGWSNWPSSDDASEFVVFDATSQIVLVDGDENKPLERKYSVHVNVHSGTILLDDND